jgi:hypothetical protein
MPTRNLYLLFILSACATPPPTPPELEMPVLVGNQLTVNCVGYGISESLSRRNAIERCQGSASAYLSREIKVKGQVWESNHSAYVLTEISSNVHIKNLECKALQENTRYTDRTATTFLKCRFDTGKATVTEEKGENSRDEATIDIRNETPNVNIGSERKLSVTSIPQCQHVTVIGVHGKTLPCTGNPSFFVVHETDKSVVIEKDGFMPYKTQLNPNGAVTSIIVNLQPTD